MVAALLALDFNQVRGHPRRLHLTVNEHHVTGGAPAGRKFVIIVVTKPGGCEVDAQAYTPCTTVMYLIPSNE